VAFNFSRLLWSSLRHWWRDQSRDQSGDRCILDKPSQLIRKLWDFAKHSMPAQRRQRYGDMEYDWENRVDTTSGTVGWRERLLGLFHSPYQPTEPALFDEMMASLPIDFEKFTFIDLGSGKGRTLLMASKYPFQKLIGVELMPELHRIAEKNIRDYRNPAQRCTDIVSVLGDASDFDFPDTPLVIYLFNPLPERALGEVLERLHNSLTRVPRPAWVVYHNPLLEDVLRTSAFLEKVGGTHQYSVYRPTDKIASE
jgi:SAM-dependent methyltransferase